MFGIGHWEMMIVAVIALLLYGKRLPEVARSLGKGMREFKSGIAGFQEELEGTVKKPAVQQSRPAPVEEREEAVAPKFEPPRFEGA